MPKDRIPKLGAANLSVAMTTLEYIKQNPGLGHNDLRDYMMKVKGCGSHYKNFENI